VGGLVLVYMHNERHLDGLETRCC